MGNGINFTFGEKIMPGTLRKHYGHAIRRPVAQAIRHRRGTAMAGGFSFIEILFAILVLGIGFIMVASIFPVAMRQTAATRDETIAAIVARGAAEHIESVATNNTMPHTTPITQVSVGGPSYPYTGGKAANRGDLMSGSRPAVWSFRDPRLEYYQTVDPIASPVLVPTKPERVWATISGRQIYAADPRYAWVGMYSRRLDNPFAQLFIVVVKATNRSRFTDADLSVTAGVPAVLEPRPIDVRLIESDQVNAADGTITPSNQPDFIQILPWVSSAATPLLPNSGPTAGDPPFDMAAAEGAFVIISDDRQEAYNAQNFLSSPDFPVFGRANGRVYRLGVARPDLGAGFFELDLGWDMEPRPKALFPRPPSTESLPVTDANAKAPAGGNRNARAFIVGRSYANPTNPKAGFEGGAMDIHFYTTFIPVY